MPKDGQQEQGGVLTMERVRTKRPSRFKVLLHNDDFTTMEFVVDILRRHFDKDETEAHTIMLMVHLVGVGVAGVFTREVAETKVSAVAEEAKAEGFPLKCSMEPE